MSDGSNIKGAPIALVPDKVKSLIDWMDVRGGQTVVVMPDNGVAFHDIAQVATIIGYPVIWPNPMRPSVRSKAERNG